MKNVAFLGVNFSDLLSGTLIPVIAVASALIAGSPAWCAGVSSIPLKMLTDTADAVVVAELLDAVVSAEAVLVSIDVVRVQKGSLQPGSILTIDSFASTFSAAQRPMDSRYPGKDLGLFFLRASANGKWALIPPVSGFLLDLRSTYIPLPRGIEAPNLPMSAKCSALDRVIVEVLPAVQSRVSATQSYRIDLASEYRGNRSTAMKELFAHLRASSNDRLRTAGLRAALIDGDLTALGNIQLEIKALPPHLIDALSKELQYHFTNSSPQAVSKLGQLSSATGSEANDRFRVAAAVALMRLHTREALPYLAVLFDDANPQLRTIGVAGLAMFANNVPIGANEPAPGKWPYRTDETIRQSTADVSAVRSDPSLVTFWKGWWDQNRSRLQ